MEDVQKLGSRVGDENVLRPESESNRSKSHSSTIPLLITNNKIEERSNRSSPEPIRPDQQNGLVFAKILTFSFCYEWVENALIAIFYRI